MSGRPGWGVGALADDAVDPVATCFAAERGGADDVLGEADAVVAAGQGFTRALALEMQGRTGIVALQVRRMAGSPHPR